MSLATPDAAVIYRESQTAFRLFWSCALPSIPLRLSGLWPQFGHFMRGACGVSLLREYSSRIATLVQEMQVHRCRTLCTLDEVSLNDVHVAEAVSRRRQSKESLERRGKGSHLHAAIHFAWSWFWEWNLFKKTLDADACGLKPPKRGRILGPKKRKSLCHAVDDWFQIGKFCFRPLPRNGCLQTDSLRLNRTQLHVASPLIYSTVPFGLWRAMASPRPLSITRRDQFIFPSVVEREAWLCEQSGAGSVPYLHCMMYFWRLRMITKLQCSWRLITVTVTVISSHQLHCNSSDCGWQLWFINGERSSPHFSRSRVGSGMFIGSMGMLHQPRLREKQCCHNPSVCKRGIPRTFGVVIN